MFHANEIAHVDGRAPRATADDDAGAAAVNEEDEAQLSLSGSYGTKVACTGFPTGLAVSPASQTEL